MNFESLLGNEKLKEKLMKKLLQKYGGELGNMLKGLLRHSHKGLDLEEGEEDFALLILQEDKEKPESRLFARVVTVSPKGEVMRYLGAHNVDGLLGRVNQEMLKK